MSSLELRPFTQGVPAREEPKSRTNFWLLVVIVSIVVLLLLLVIFFVIVPVNTVKTDVNNITDTVTTLSPKIDKLTTDGQTTLSLVDTFVRTAEADLDKISKEGEKILSNTEVLVKTAQTDLQNAIYDFCNFTSIDINGDKVTIGIREAFPTLCKDVPQPVKTSSGLAEPFVGAGGQSFTGGQSFAGGRTPVPQCSVHQNMYGQYYECPHSYGEGYYMY